MKIDIPGYRTLDLRYLLLDYNGTLAVDGRILDPVRQRLHELSRHLQIQVLTADTHGTAREKDPICRNPIARQIGKPLFCFTLLSCQFQRD